MFRKIKSFIQRGRRGYADEDLWDFHRYLSGIIPPAVRHLKENIYGCPHELYDQSRVNDECHKWESILEEIAQGFDAAKIIADRSFMRTDEDGKLNFNEDEYKNQMIKYNRGMELLKKHFFGMWD